MFSVCKYWRVWIGVLALATIPAWKQAGAQEPQPDWPMTQPGNPAASLCEDETVYLPPRCPFYVRVEGLALRRDVHHAVDFATVNDPFDVVLSTRDIDKPFKAGVNFLVGHTFGESPYQIEASYFAIDSFDDRAAVRNPDGNLYSPFSGFGSAALVAGFDNNDFVQIREFSNLQSGELNLLRLLPVPPERLTTSFIIGARFMRVREELDYNSQTHTGINQAIRVNTRNDLFGPQIGGRFDYNVDHWWWINTEVKGAICNNSARQDTFYTAPGPIGNAFGRSQDVTSFVGDISVTLVCRPTSWLSARVGYQAMWLTGMAIAAKNFDPNVNILTVGPAQINHNGTVVYHGPHAGLEITW